MIATHPYKGEDDDELTFETGEVIYVVEYDDPEEQVSRTGIKLLTLISSDMRSCITLLLPVPSAYNFCKQFGPRSGPTLCWYTCQKEFFEKSDFEKNWQTTVKYAKFPSIQRVNDS